MKVIHESKQDTVKILFELKKGVLTVFYPEYSQTLYDPPTYTSRPGVIHTLVSGKYIWGENYIYYNGEYNIWHADLSPEVKILILKLFNLG